MTEFANEIPNQAQLTPQTTTPTLTVDFTYKKWQARIMDPSSLEPSQPLYTMHFQCFKCPTLLFKSQPSGTTIGTGTLQPISINAYYTVNGQKGKLKALKRWRSSYTHLSNAYAESGGPPVLMEWTSSCSFKTWDFVCCDAQQNPVARFSANAWALRKIGKIEFLGPKANDPAVRDEIVVTGLTLFYTMLLRTSSIMSFFGAIFAKTGPLEEGEGGPTNEEVEIFQRDAERASKGVETDSTDDEFVDRKQQAYRRKVQ